MNRISKEKEYWDKAALDPEVDDKYICNLPDDTFFEIVGNLEGIVLEIGCGVGRLIQKGYCGIDISNEMLNIARKRKPDNEFRLCDGREIPYPDESFDSVYCVLVFQHLPVDAVNNYIAEASRVLKRGGQFIFQFIESDEDEPFSKGHRDLIFNGFRVVEKLGSRIHPSWTWIKLTK